MDESRILPTSQPFVIVRFIKTGDYISTTYEDAGQGSTATSQAIAMKPGIISLTTEGRTSIARKAVVRITDPTLYVTNSIMRTANATRLRQNPGAPDIQIIWGWKYLLPDSMRYYEQYAYSRAESTTIVDSSMYAMMLKTKFDINEMGVTEVEIETLETSVPIMGSAAFVAPIDIMNWKKLKDTGTVPAASSGGSGARVGRSGNVSDRTYSSSFIGKIEQFINESASLKLTAGDGVGNSYIQFVFDTAGFTSSDWDTIFNRGAAANINSVFSDVKITYNQSVESFINEIFSKIPKQDKNEGTYEIIGNERVADVYNDDGSIRTPGYTKIKFGWKKSVLNSDGTTSTAIKDMPINYILRWGTESFEEDQRTGTAGQGLYDLKTAGQSYSSDQGITFTADRGHTRRGYYKYLVNWSSDLSSKTYLHFMAQTELERGLKRFDTVDMDAFINALNEGKSLEEIQAMGGSATTPGVGKVLGEGFANNVYQGLNTVSSGITSQMNSLVANNVFKATASVIGDPELGMSGRTSNGTWYSYEPYTSGVFTEFRDVSFQQMFTGAPGEVSSQYNSNLAAFSRKWMITKVVHKIEAGQYTTDLELMTYPGI